MAGLLFHGTKTLDVEKNLGIDLCTVFEGDEGTVEHEDPLDFVLRPILDVLSTILTERDVSCKAAKYVALYSTFVNSAENQPDPIQFYMHVPIKGFACVKEGLNQLYGPEGHQRLINCPSVLFIQCLRFDYIDGANQKLLDEFDFPHTLDLRQFVKCDGTSIDCQYQLHAVQAHSGLVDFGHYVTYVKEDTHTWREYNDNKTKIKCDSAENETVLMESLMGRPKVNNQLYAYVLVYVKQSDVSEARSGLPLEDLTFLEALYKSCVPVKPKQASGKVPVSKKGRKQGEVPVLGVGAAELHIPGHGQKQCKGLGLGVGAADSRALGRGRKRERDQIGVI